MKPSEVLTKARDLLEDKGWTQGSMAHNSIGEAVSAHSPYAVCFCAMGATSRILGSDRPLGVVGHERAFYNAFSVPNVSSITGSNDALDTKLLHVLMAFDFAVLMALDEEK